MKRRIQKFPCFYIHWPIFVAVFSGVISIPFSAIAIALPHSHSRISSLQLAQVSSSDESKSAKLARAKEVTQGFFDSLIGEQFEQAREYFSPSIQQYFSASDLEQQWQKVLKQKGSFVRYKKIRPAAIFDTYTVLMTANFENSISDFVVTLDSNQQITAVDFLLIGNIQVNAEEFVDALSKGSYAVARGYLTPELKETELPENIKEKWFNILAETGSFKRISNSKVVQSPSGSDVVLVNLEFEQENRSMMIIFNPLSEIVGIDFPQAPDQSN